MLYMEFFIDIILLATL